MTVEGLIALAGATALFALIPGPGIMAVVAQALSRGLGPAVMWITGQVLGDMIYLLMAMFGLGWVASQLGDGFIVLRYVGAAYLIWMGFKAWTAKPPCENVTAPPARAGGRYFLGGMCVSLGNPKAIAFYCGFLPAFIDLTVLTSTDAATVIAVICPIVFVIPVGYAWLAARGRGAIRTTRIWKIANRSAGAVMIGAGATVAAE
ncbi:LysE family translocator [Desulfovibrio ferrophilus]|uniref:Lysine exporter protein LYSE/YGGA n=1 Tax=Desulfovibrio ferrophilus TaxID=241368 RepID=A0A2Z6AVJ8_9BACT|nr:LysE family translocator [Desulfovibrio ferrophilus]BBD07272.1 lysine exporter protein LYSE/YGGA [Desulfovibrio ferrophilus]